MPCHAESSRASRMREIRPSGLMRAEAAATLPLRYSTVSAVHQAKLRPTLSSRTTPNPASADALWLVR